MNPPASASEIRSASRETASNALADDEAILFAAFDQLNDAVFVQDGATGAVLHVNQPAVKLYGFSPEEAQRMDIGQLSEGLAPYAQENVLEWTRKAMAGERPVFEWHARRRSGELFWAEVSLCRLDLTTGARVVAFLRDISRRKAEAQRREEVEQRLRTIFETSNAGIFISDVSGRIVVANKRLAEMFKLSEEEICARDYPDLVHLSDRPDSARLYAALMEGRLQTSDVERQYVRPDGSSFWGLICGRRIVSGDGVASGLVGVIIDSTERRQIENALRESEARFRSMIRSASDLFCLVTADLRFKFVSPVSLELTGYTPRELLGSLEPTVHPEDWPRVHAAWDAFHRETGSGLRVEYRHIHRSRGYVWVEALARDGKSDSAATFAMTVRDISERKRAEISLEEARHAAEAANEAKSAFLANMSHEIRTPLNAVVGLTYLLEQTELGTRQQNYVKSLNGALRALQSIVNDILDFSKIEAGRLDLERGEFDLDEVFDELACVAGVATGGKAIEVCVDVPPDVPRHLLGDAARLGQVLSNLCHNAIKFTHSGEVIVGVELLERLPGRVKLEFSVRDTGIGIAPELLDKLFKPFSQIDASTTRRFGGTGLGLAISRSLVHRMGGEIKVESSEGGGSVFRFALPFELVDRGATGASPFAGKRILIVDSHATTRRLIRRMLEADGAIVDEFDELTPAHSAFGCADLALLDDGAWETGGCGYQLDEKDTCPPVVVMLSPGHYADPGEHVLGENCSCGIGPAAFMLKPVTALSLRDSIGGALDSHGDVPLDASLGKVLAGMSIMVVDDSPIGLMVSREVLERAGAKVLAVDCGQGALDAASGSAQRPEVILMDLQMPELDGFETTRRLRAEEKASGADPARIIGLSANALSGTPERCIAAGMDDYISKPVDIPRLIACLEINGGRRSASEPALAGSAWADTQAWGETLPGVDLGELSKRFDGSRETVTRLFKFLLDEHADAFDQFEQTYQSGDRAAAAALLHDLVGLAASLAAHRLLAETRSLQSSLRRGEVAPQERAALGRAFAELIDSARQFSAGHVHARTNAGLSH